MPSLVPTEHRREMLRYAKETSWEDAARRASPAVVSILEKALSGACLTFEDGMQLASVDAANLDALVKAADELRRRAVGDVITYVVNRNLNFTNVCFVGCEFCGFSRGPHASDSYFHSNEKLIAKAREAAECGATEVCIQGGLPKDLNGFYYRDLLRDIKKALPRIHVHAFSPMEIAYGVEKTGLPLKEYLSMLKQEGLGSIPGTAAEILDDEVRSLLSPNKLKVAMWVEIIRTAHMLGIPTTSTMMYGHVERREHWVRHILLLREIQMETHGFTEFVPLGFIHPKTRLYQIGKSRPGYAEDESLIVHALARVLLNGYIRNIQVSWVKLGFEGSLACLNAGASDFGGTLMEESISKAAGAMHGEYVSPGQLQSLILSTGRIPAERSTTYKILRTLDADREHDDKGRGVPTMRAMAAD